MKIVSSDSVYSFLVLVYTCMYYKTCFSSKYSCIVYTRAMSASIDIVRASDGRTPLHLSSLAGHSVAVQYLLDKGTDCNRKDTTHGYTPLDLALLHGHSSVGDSLISSGGCTGAGRIHESATKIQQCWRRYVIKRQEFVTRDWAARKIQYQYRSWSDKKRAKRVRRLREKRRNEAALIIQRNWLTYISIKRKKEQSYLALKTKLNYEYITILN
ncbi:PREDICTED: ankyrin repeat-containing protein C6C3.08-like [Amphimedon queenslandica]|uniref:Uncharacterized protein n=2 Tax=Amphimedon queenslandica TaxID=400682 RepID=A0AAN0JT39_AMPQE|nr:PREDICTED: ankyrin repeat-containing protein C6C3.08-like [Amphimedon queenslandica]|eukprot:XP_019860210.1 PREDICTED: ankyrin repeat-containing protein C6C3.08-like [Amphimedon queenslandica]